MNIDWLTICAEGQSGVCTPAVQVAYLAGLVVAVILLAIVARSPSRSTSRSARSSLPSACRSTLTRLGRFSSAP